MKMTAKDALLFGGIGLGLYLIWQGKEKFKEVGDWLSAPIAYVISKLTLPRALHIAGGAVLPDGGYVSWDAITQAGSKLDAQGMFVWRGQRYKVRSPRRADGNYAALPA